MKLIPAGVKSIVTYSENLNRPARHIVIKGEADFTPVKEGDTTNNHAFIMALNSLLILQGFSSAGSPTNFDFRFFIMKGNLI